MSDTKIREALQAVLATMDIHDVSVRLERPNDPSHGDFATNLALTLASRLGRGPRDIAAEIVERLQTHDAGIQGVEIAGPGFLNFRLASDRVTAVVADILAGGGSYGKTHVGENRDIVVEFVSANPTGPLHLGHGRQAALGDAITELLAWTGWSVSREYYYNDTGVQIDRLTQSVWARYQQHHGLDAELPEDGYQGEYITQLAAEFSEEHGAPDGPEPSSEELEEVRTFAVAHLRRDQDETLHQFRVHFDTYFLESSLYERGSVDATITALRETGLVYESEGATWLRTTAFGDQKDRVMIKSDGSATYFLPDVAYHIDKWERGFHDAINIQGSDHHGTVARVRAGVQALGRPEGYPEYVLHQMVRVEQGGREVKFSKRSGSYTTLRELVEAVGVDVTRYFFQMRKPEAHLVFDLDLALDQSDKNPVYKIQYAHARMCSIFAKAGLDIDAALNEAPKLDLLDADLERDLINQLARFTELVSKAAELRAPHLLCDYLERTAGSVNSWYHAGNPSRRPELAVLVDDPALRVARLALAQAVRVVLRNGLTILGISAPIRMDREDTPPQEAQA